MIRHGLDDRARSGRPHRDGALEGARQKCARLPSFPEPSIEGYHPGVPNDDEGARVRLGTVEVPDYVRPIYANFLNVNHTPWDFRLVFALVRAPMPGTETQEAEQAEAVHPQAVAEVVIPANLMHGVISALKTTFDSYIEQHGAPGLEAEGPRFPEE